jgi:hypothetical protein
MLIYTITSPNLPGTFYVGSTENLKQRWDKGHQQWKTHRCSSKYIMQHGEAKPEVIETIVPSVNPIRHDLEDRETFHILRLRAEGMTVVNEYLPGAGRRAGKHVGLKNSPWKCDRCDLTVLRRCKLQHQRTKRCMAFSSEVCIPCV